MKTTTIFTRFVRSSRQRGFSLAEVMIGVAVFAVTLLGFWGGLIAIRINNRALSQNETAYAATRELMELVRGLGFTGLNYSPDVASGLDPVRLKVNDARWAARTSDPADWVMPEAPTGNAALAPTNVGYVPPDGLTALGSAVQWKTFVVEDAVLNSGTPSGADLYAISNNYGRTTQLVNGRWTARIWHYRTSGIEPDLVPAALASIQPQLVSSSSFPAGTTSRQWEYKELEVVVKWRLNALTGEVSTAADNTSDNRAWKLVWLRSVLPGSNASAL